MRSVILADVIQETRSGFWGTDPGSADLDVRVVRNGDIQEDGVRWDSLPLRSVSRSEAERATLRKDDVLITTSGDCGYAAHIQSVPDEPTIASNFIRILRFDTARVMPRFLYHVIHSRAFRANLAPYIRGTALKNLSFVTAAERIRVPLPSTLEQRRLAEILDKADALQAKRRAALAQIDTITQSIFLDMFGDPAVNPHGFPRRPLASLVREDDTINYGVVQPGDDLDEGEGVPLVRVGDLVEGKVRHSELKRIAPSIEAAHKRSRLRGDELLVSCVGSIGVIALADESVKGFNVARAVARVPIASTTNRQFMSEYLRTDFVQRYFTSELRTVSQPTLNIKQLSETPVVVPPVALQHEFASRVASVEMLRTAEGASLGNLSALFATLEHRAFRGEL